MKKTILSILILIALVVVIVLKLRENKTIVKQRVYHYDRNRAINVHTTKLKGKEVVINKNYTGNFISELDGKINADVQGKVIALKVNVGDYVKKGQLLLKIDPTLLKIKKRTLDIKIKGLANDVKRYKVLLKADAIQAIKLEKTQLALNAALQERKSVIEQIKKTNITAPFNGYITVKFTEVGSFAAPGMPLLQLTNTNDMQFLINVADDDIDLFEKNKEYPIYIQTLGQTINAKLSNVSTKANRSNDYAVRFDIPKEKKSLIRAGMFGNIEVNKIFPDKKILIPLTSIQETGTQPKVYVVKNGKAVLKPIEIEKYIDNNAIVKKGLKDGDILITSGFINLFEGANVQIN